jgi:hypothetical protein
MLIIKPGSCNGLVLVRILTVSLASCTAISIVTPCVSRAKLLYLLIISVAERLKNLLTRLISKSEATLAKLRGIRNLLSKLVGLSSRKVSV